MLQRFISILLVGAGMYACYSEMAFWVGILLVAIGAGLYGGASYGLLFYFGLNDDNDGWRNGDGGGD